jgi:hypothetical protein
MSLLSILTPEGLAFITFLKGEELIWDDTKKSKK